MCELKSNQPQKSTRFANYNIIWTIISAKKASDQGATVAISLVVAFAVIAGTAFIARRSIDGFLGSAFQGRAKDARLTAEAGTAFIISEWNRPANRRLYTGLPMASWSSAKNRCTASSPTFDVANAASPTKAATSFANGNEVPLPSSSTDTRRTFRLLNAKFTSGSAANRSSTPYTVTASSAGDTTLSPAISETKPRGFLELVVEGRIYLDGKAGPVATSRVTREFIVEPKCCNRSFGTAVQNVDIGNDYRTCEGGGSDLPIGDMAIITGLGGGGGLTQNSDSQALKVVDSSNNPLETITCTRPEGSASKICDFRSNDLRTKNGIIDYVIKPITIPSPPSIASAQTSFQEKCNSANGASCSNILNGTGLSPTSGTIITSPKDSTQNTSNCHYGSFPAGSDPAYHCKVSSINLSGNGNTLTVDTTNAPVYLYLQGVNQNITVGGQAAIIHRNNNSVASLAQTNRLQIRGIPAPTSSSCTSSQTFDLFGNASTAMFIWAPCATTNMKGTTNFGGIIWSNNLDFSGGGTGQIKLAIPSKPGTCIPDSTEIPCKVLEDTGLLPESKSPPIDWAARSINFTRFF